ncbi:uncharacterized protein LAESUDRAFT_304440 [Laetiporus sulphureus 93-53]|uniref:Uncharacterized protein n=1 Tax=Laetiporus sulphureus 93-53 TaxID=1314785 RepID=A0A165D898_9APHY|nr:uncharacterized protein LAESUDRAFT_304440 [Laetiporus sulphureus 93-53]KZT04315.1 hypothetical protein LAESUDRAFT_304440 [Laetiporus sulphureus 93-53]
MASAYTAMSRFGHHYHNSTVHSCDNAENKVVWNNSTGIAILSCTYAGSAAGLRQLMRVRVTRWSGATCHIGLPIWSPRHRHRHGWRRPLSCNGESCRFSVDIPPCPYQIETSQLTISMRWWVILNDYCEKQSRQPLFVPTHDGFRPSVSIFIMEIMTVVILQASSAYGRWA